MSKLEDGQQVFYCHPDHSWIEGNVQGAPDGKDNYTIKDAKNNAGNSSVHRDLIYPINNPAIVDEDVDDLLLLSELHNSTLLNTLRSRYLRDVVYTYIGPIVIAINPFNYKIPWYKDDFMPNYLIEGPVIQKNKPHSWSVAHNTYFEMITDKANQCVLVSGESGAGKTEAVKIVIKYLRGLMNKRAKDDDHRAQLEIINQKVLQASPILEAFGNAKTGRNDNSSRFGKFLQVQFTTEGFIAGSFAIAYLLEKSRVITASEGERIYHSFYQVVKGKDAAKYKLESPQNYPSVMAGKVLDNASMEDAEGDDLSYRMSNEAYAVCNVSLEAADGVWRSCAAICHLQRIKYKTDGDKGVFDGDTAKYADLAAELWKIPADVLKTELLQTTSEVRGESFTVMHTEAAAITIRDSLSKTVYKGVFDVLFTLINAGTNAAESANWIGLLDIFGFEDFPVNSFEQLCINLANETLQNHYNGYVFTRDMEECQGEGIDTTSVEFADNTITCSLLTAKLGIFPLLDEECALGKGSDLGFLDKIAGQHKDHPSFDKKTLWKDCFSVKHFAGTVKYTVTDFLLKNKDQLKDQFKLLFREQSSCIVAKEVLPAPVDKKGRAPTVSGTFAAQIGSLMDMINSTNPHWIRCVKPHPAKKPLLFHGVQSMNQLISSGVIETVRIRMLGFPVRIPHLAFLARFAILAKKKGLPCEPGNPGPGCENILKGAEFSKAQAQIGKTKVFLKSHIYQAIEELKREAMKDYGIMVQKFARCVVATRKAKAKLRLMYIKWAQAEIRDWLRASAVERAKRAAERAEMMAKLKDALEGFFREEDGARKEVFAELERAYKELTEKGAASKAIATQKEMDNMETNENIIRDQIRSAEDADRKGFVTTFASQWKDLLEREKNRVAEVKRQFASRFENLLVEEQNTRRKIKDEEAEAWQGVLAAIKPLLDEIFIKVEKIMERFRRREKKLAKLNRMKEDEVQRIEKQREDDMFVHRQAVDKWTSEQERERATELERIADVNEVTRRMASVYVPKPSSIRGTDDASVSGGGLDSAPAVEIGPDGRVKLLDSFDKYKTSWKGRFADEKGEVSSVDGAPRSPRGLGQATGAPTVSAGNGFPAGAASYPASPLRSLPEPPAMPIHLRVPPNAQFPGQMANEPSPDRGGQQRPGYAPGGGQSGVDPRFRFFPSAKSPPPDDGSRFYGTPALGMSGGNGSHSSPQSGNGGAAAFSPPAFAPPVRRLSNSPGRMAGQTPPMQRQFYGGNTNGGGGHPNYSSNLPLHSQSPLSQSNNRFPTSPHHAGRRSLSPRGSPRASHSPRGSGRVSGAGHSPRASSPAAGMFTVYTANGEKRVFEVRSSTTFGSLMVKPGYAVSNQHGMLFPPGERIIDWGVDHGYLVRDTMA